MPITDYDSGLPDCCGDGGGGDSGYGFDDETGRGSISSVDGNMCCDGGSFDDEAEEGYGSGCGDGSGSLHKTGGEDVQPDEYPF